MQKDKRIRFTIWMALAVAWVLVMLFLSGQNAMDSSELSGWLTQLVSNALAFLHLNASQLEAVLRKTAHFGIFAVEGFLLHAALAQVISRRKRCFLTALVPCAILAVVTELEQLFAEGRACSPIDMGIDSCGALLGILVSCLILWLLAKRKA